MTKGLLKTCLLLSSIGLSSTVAFSNPNNLTKTNAEVSSKSNTNEDNKQIGKNWMRVSAISSAKSHDSQSVQISFSTGYSSFSTNKASSISSTVTRGSKIDCCKDIEATDASDFEAFYYEGKNGQKAFGSMTAEEKTELANLSRSNYKEHIPTIYEGLIRSVDSVDSKNSVCLLPRVIYQSDVGNAPYAKDYSSWDLAKKSEPIFVTSLGDKIYAHDDVIFFGMNPSKIDSEALQTNGANTFTTILIPKNVKTIKSDAFFHGDIKPLTTCTFVLEATEAETKSSDYHYEAGCFGTNPVVYGDSETSKNAFSSYYEKDIDGTSEETYKTSKNARTTNRNAAFPTSGIGKDYDYNPDPTRAGKNNYVFGYYPDDTTKTQPFTAEFDVLNKETKAVIGKLKKEVDKNSGDVLSVGPEIYKVNNTVNIDMIFDDLKLNDGTAFDSKTMEINPKSICLYNIFHATKSGDTFVAQLEKETPEDIYYGAFSCKSKATEKDGELRIAFEDTMHIDSFINISFKGLTTFIGYTAINFDMSITDQSIYQTINPSSYKTYKDKIESGEVYVRYRIDSLKQGKFKIKTKDGDTILVPIETPIKQFVLEGKNNNLCFIVKNSELGKKVSLNNIEKIDLIGCYISLDLSTLTTGPIGRTGVTTRFGAVNIMPAQENVKIFNANKVALIIYLIYTAVYCAVMTALFFIFKNKFKNDEFRRVNPKKYLKNSIIGFVSLGIVLGAVLAIIFRLTLFRNAIVVFNPVDAFIIAFGIASIIIIGFYIKALVVQTKAIKARNNARKLKLDQDKVDDGTK